jgi:hypothetical protein
MYFEKLNLIIVTFFDLGWSLDSPLIIFMPIIIRIVFIFIHATFIVFPFIPSSSFFLIHFSGWSITITIIPIIFHCHFCCPCYFPSPWTYHASTFHNLFFGWSWTTTLPLLGHHLEVILFLSQLLFWSTHDCPIAICC